MKHCECCQDDAFERGACKGCPNSGNEEKKADISILNALSEQRSYNAEAVKRIDVLESALRKLITVSRSEWVSGEWVAKVAEEALKGAAE